MYGCDSKNALKKHQQEKP